MRLCGRLPGIQFVLVAVALITGAGAAFAAPATGSGKVLVDVKMTSAETGRELAAHQFDIAGVNRAAMTVGIVASEADLQRLAALGYVYTVRRALDREPSRAPLGLDQYTDPLEMETFVDQVVAAYPGLVQKIMLEPTLFEGQHQYAVKITKDVGQPNERPAFLLDAQHHAREVMTPEITKDAIDWLTSRYATDPAVQRWVDNINIYIVPIVNPDGALYVFQHDTGWRKNRHPGCAVDNNRNYPFAWNACGGSSGDCGSETYRGTSGGSEPETQGMMSITDAAHPFFSLSYHSYGQYLMYSYGCSDPDEKAALDQVAQTLNAMLQDDNGNTGNYATGPIGTTIYTVDGGSTDTQYGIYGSPAFVIEVNTSDFQPDYNTWRDITVQRQRTAWQYFLDQTLDHAQIRGKVTDTYTGQPIAATVALSEVTYTHGETPRHADGRGFYQLLTQANQTYHLTVSAPGYCSVTRTVDVGSGPATADVALGHPLAPAGTGAAASGTASITVSWNPVTEATEYHVYRSLTSGGPYVQVGTAAAPQTSFVDHGVSGGVPYFYVVRAFNQCESNDSPESTATTTGPCLLAPSFAGLTSAANAQTTTCTVSLAWPAAHGYCAGPLTYRVYRSTVAPFTPSPSTLIAAGITGTTYSDHNGAGNSLYHYIVRAVDATSGAEDGNTIMQSMTPTGPLAPGTFRDDAGDTAPAQLTGDAPWSVLASGGKAGPKVYATGNYTDNLCSALTTPVINLQTGAGLAFASKYDIEATYDAGIVEVATGPSFTNWTKLTTVNYPDQLTNAGTSCGFPSSGAHTVFSRTIATPTYTSTPYTGSLSAYSNQQIKLRFRFGSDSGTTAKGWWIDDIRVTNALIPTTCTAGVAPNPKEASPNAAPLTATRGAGSGIEVVYLPACGALDHAAYWGLGPIQNAVSWTASACALGTTGHAAIDPGTLGPGGLAYFVVVGQTATKEGSYGQATSAERPEASGIGACDRPQDLTGVCP